MREQILLEGITAFFAAVGVVALIWLTLGVCLREKKRSGISEYTVIAAEHWDADCASSLYSILWWRGGLSAQNKVLVCTRTKSTPEIPGVLYATPDALARYIKQEWDPVSSEETDETGTDTTGGNR